jgi:hypothetical protein
VKRKSLFERMSDMARSTPQPAPPQPMPIEASPPPAYPVLRWRVYGHRNLERITITVHAPSSGEAMNIAGEQGISIGRIEPLGPVE